MTGHRATDTACARSRSAGLTRLVLQQRRERMAWPKTNPSVGLPLTVSTARAPPRYLHRVNSNDDPTDGHARFHELSAAVREGQPDDDAALLATLLAEPDRLMAESVLASLVDTRAEVRGSAASFAAWVERVLDAVGGDGFIARRVQEWTLFKALQSGAPVDREALAAATNWLQRKVIEEADSAAVLTVLGEVGRTKRVRNLAKTRAGRLRSSGR
jgi:hypothetical protein